MFGVQEGIDSVPGFLLGWFVGPVGDRADPAGDGLEETQVTLGEALAMGLPAPLRKLLLA